MFRRNLPKKIKKDYQRKNLRNPFFHSRTEGKSWLSWKWLVPVGILLLIFLSWFFWAAPFWRLQQVKIEGLSRIPGGDLEKIIWQQAEAKRWLFFKQSNIFLFAAAEADQAILTAYNFAGVEIKKVWPHTLTVKINERPYAFIFQEGNDRFYGSADAYLIKEAPVQEADLKKYFILENKGATTLVGAKNKIDIGEAYLQFILELNNRLLSYSELPVEKFIIDQEFNTIKAKFLNGPVVYFSVKDSAQKQIGLLLLVKKEKIKDNFSKTNYIDLRYGDKIFINPDFK